MYNLEFKKDTLEEITLEFIQEIIALVMIEPITTIAPLGFSGDDIVLYGEHISKNDSDDGMWHRKSLITIRNHNNTPEFLITDKKGTFLFYGSFDVNDYEFMANTFYSIFLNLKDKVDGFEPKPKKVELDFSKATMSDGFKILQAAQDYIKSNNNTEELK